MWTSRYFIYKYFNMCATKYKDNFPHNHNVTTTTQKIHHWDTTIISYKPIQISPTVHRLHAFNTKLRIPPRKTSSAIRIVPFTFFLFATSLVPFKRKLLVCFHLCWISGQLFFGVNASKPGAHLYIYFWDFNIYLGNYWVKVHFSHETVSQG